jgi:16S rRNA (adenine1518-N6/adenine1519-N6)-dimethyltransferase
VLTEALLMQGCRVTAIEIDEGAVKHLQSIFASEIASGQLNLLSGDALQVKWPTSISKVVANIPYQISSPLVELLTKYLRDDEVKLLQKVVLLVQEEFAERLVMEYESDVGSLGMTALLDWQSEMLQKVPPHNFSPNPKVNSCFIEMKPSHEQFECDKRLVKQVIHQAFKQRRKKIRTSLKSIPRRLNRVPNWYSARWKLAISSLADDERMNARPEEFDFDDWIEFCQDLEKIQDKS